MFQIPRLMFIVVSLAAITIVLASLASNVRSIAAEPVAKKAGESAAKPVPKPVDDDMHHFMEYVFQPTYLQLKPNMAKAPKDKAGWKKVKAGSLILAESSNLLLLRAPDKDADTWKQMSVAVRESGGALYQAARKQDFATARQHYAAMIQRCNACHKKFADGEHQLKP